MEYLMVICRDNRMIPAENIVFAKAMQELKKKSQFCTLGSLFIKRSEVIGISLVSGEDLSKQPGNENTGRTKASHQSATG